MFALVPLALLYNGSSARDCVLQSLYRFKQTSLHFALGDHVMGQDDHSANGEPDDTA